MKKARRLAVHFQCYIGESGLKDDLSFQLSLVLYVESHSVL